MTTNNSTKNFKSGRKPRNEVDVCGPKSGDASRPSIKQSGMDHRDLAVERDVINQFFAAQVACNESEQHSLGHAYACIFFAKNKQNKYKPTWFVYSPIRLVV